jgi:alpha-glucosidase (family GH31 glycosyl hydrolase)
MDFARDPKALEQNYAYMFGPSFLVAPVLEQATEQWEVYLPENQSGWVNFWTGEHFDGGQTINVEASLPTIPLFVKSGSIIPMGKFMQYSNKKRQTRLKFVYMQEKMQNFNCRRMKAQITIMKMEHYQPYHSKGTPGIIRWL